MILSDILVVDDFTEFTCNYRVVNDFIQVNSGDRDRNTARRHVILVAVQDATAPGDDVEGDCSGDWTGGQIVDEVVIPADIPKGDYVVGASPKPHCAPLLQTDGTHGSDFVLARAVCLLCVDVLTPVYT